MMILPLSAMSFGVLRGNEPETGVKVDMLPLRLKQLADAA